MSIIEVTSPPNETLWPLSLTSNCFAAIVPPFVRIGGVVEPHEVNGQPGAIFRDRDGKVLNTWALDILDGQIQTIRTVLNPDKLGHVGPVSAGATDGHLLDVTHLL